ncbi:unnamed protein product [Meganyctiphanes norvegica]|uniref:Uncharacterized protein n=1 Tax=Meganyctiphanes norvegica TaxID=48144 RepID=A0AAV2RG52_MEGNR
MGCGSSQAIPVLDDQAPESMKDPLPDSPQSQTEQTEQVEELTSVHSNTPDHSSQQVDPGEPPTIIQNGTAEVILPSPPDSTEKIQHQQLPEALPSLPTPPSSGQSRGGVAFEVEVPVTDASIVKRHPPRKFQKLEDQQLGATLTQEKLEEKQAVAEKRRQEILTQRVQSAKQRMGRSAGRLRARPDTDEVEQDDDGIIESDGHVDPENEM